MSQPTDHDLMSEITATLSERIKSLAATMEEIEAMKEIDREIVTKTMMLATEILIEAQSQTHMYLEKVISCFATIEKQETTIAELTIANHQLADIIYKNDPPIHTITGRA